MNNVFVDSANHWNVFYEDPCGFFPADTSALLPCTQVLRIVKTIFEERFGIDYVNSRSPLAIMYSTETPQTFKEHHLIFLTSHHPYYQQMVYQFAHELFHFMIPGRIIEEYRWFEESLAELSSLLTLRSLYEQSPRFSSSAFAPYLSTTPAYIANVQRSAIQNPYSTVSEFIKNNLSSMQRDCYMRAHNKVVANALYDLFHVHPELWITMLGLPDFTADRSLRDNLDRLVARFQNDSDAINDMIHILCD